MGLKTLHRFTLKAYLLPFLLTFFIALFVLFMQFLWKWVDEIVGKGLEWQVICQLFFYASLSLVPLALPLSILLSSLMTFGSLAEHYELAALKASGLSLQRIMMPLIVFTFAISVSAFYFSNNLLPYVNLKMNRLMFDIQNQKPAFNIKEGVFYGGIENYSIRVGKKGNDGKSIMNVLIYDHTPEGNNRIITAESGVMEMTSDKKYLILTLENGCSYEELQKDKDPAIQSIPFLRNKYKEQVVRFDLSSFKMNKTNEALFKDNHQMLNVPQLVSMIDTFDVQGYKLHSEFHKVLSTVYFSNAMHVIEREQVKEQKKQLKAVQKNGQATVPKDNASREAPVVKRPDFLESLSKQDRHMVIESALGMVRTAKGTIESRLNEIQSNTENKALFQIELHKKFALPFSCLVMFFIGAPLGAIIRKGGLGMPVIVSACFFVLYWVISISGEKMAKEGVMPVAGGIWMAPAFLLPLGIYFTRKATADSSLFDVDSYLLFITRITNPRAAALKKQEELERDRIRNAPNSL